METFDRPTAACGRSEIRYFYSMNTAYRALFALGEAIRDERGASLRKNLAGSLYVHFIDSRCGFKRERAKLEGGIFMQSGSKKTSL